MKNIKLEEDWPLETYEAGGFGKLEIGIIVFIIVGVMLFIF